MTSYAMEMVRGDTMTFRVSVKDIDPENITSLTFTVKKKGGTDQEIVIQETLGDGIEEVAGAENPTWTVRIAPEDTHGVAAGRYTYDIQIGINQDIYTPIGGSFRIAQDVTDN